MPARTCIYSSSASNSPEDNDSLERIDLLPVALHVHDGPALRGRLVQGLVESPDGGLAIVRPLALGVGVADQAHEPGAVAGRGPLEHLQIPVRITERQDRAP